MTDISALQNRLWRNKTAKGFNITNVELEFNFLYGELAELFEAYRQKRSDVDEEIADVILYTISLAKMMNVDVETALEKKMAKNERRTYRKVGNAHVRTDKEKS